MDSTKMLNSVDSIRPDPNLHITGFLWNQWRKQVYPASINQSTISNARFTTSAWAGACMLPGAPPSMSMLWLSSSDGNGGVEENGPRIPKETGCGVQYQGYVQYDQRESGPEWTGVLSHDATKICSLSPIHTTPLRTHIRARTRAMDNSSTDRTWRSLSSDGRERR